MVSVVSSCLIFLLFLRGCLINSQLTRLDKQDCTCSGDPVQYECIINGTGNTVYNISGCVLTLASSRFGTSESEDRDCADQHVQNTLRPVAKGVESVNSSHISSLNFTALFDVTVRCSLEGDSASLKTDYVNVITDNFVFPSIISVDENHAERVCTFNWSFDCPGVRYNLSPNCSSGSSCVVDSDNRVRCSGIEPGSQCSVRIQPIVCGNVSGQFSPVASCTIIAADVPQEDNRKAVIAGVAVAVVFIVAVVLLIGGLAIYYLIKKRGVKKKNNRRKVKRESELNQVSPNGHNSADGEQEQDTDTTTTVMKQQPTDQESGTQLERQRVATLTKQLELEKEKRETDKAEANIELEREKRKNIILMEEKEVEREKNESTRKELESERSEKDKLKMKLEGENRRLEAELQRERGETDRVKGELEREQDEKERLKQELQKEKSDNTANTEKIKKLEDDLKIKDDKIKNLESELDRLQNIVKELEDTKLKVNKELKDTKMKINTLWTFIEEHTSKIKSLDEAVANLNNVKANQKDVEKLAKTVSSTSNYNVQPENPKAKVPSKDSATLVMTVTDLQGVQKDYPGKDIEVASDEEFNNTSRTELVSLDKI